MHLIYQKKASVHLFIWIKINFNIGMIASLFNKFLAFNLIFHVTYHIVLAIFVLAISRKICFFKRLKWIKLTETLIV